jgi:hypothetical protein
MLKLKTMNRSAKRLAKGLAAIFAIKFLLLLGVMAFQACQKENEEFKYLEQQEAITKFERVVKETTPKIRNLVEGHFSSLDKNAIINGNLSDRVMEETQRAMMPMVNGTKELLRAYDIEEVVLTEEFGDANDPRIALVGLLLLAADSKEYQETAVNFAQAFGSFSYANSNTVINPVMSDWVDCLIVAVGIDVVVEFVSGNITEAFAKKAIKKIAKRALGVIGAAIAAYEFGSCMGWY